MKDIVIYIHGKGGNIQEADYYKILFPNCEVTGFDYSSQTPWEAEREFAVYLASVREKYNTVILVANSIGAFFAMCAHADRFADRAYFVSPIVDMEKLIQDMLIWAEADEAELKEKGLIETDFGETLSWEYLSWVRNNELRWSLPTRILYGSRDNLQSYDIVSGFSKKTGSELTVMEGAEHWFHTEEQMKFLKEWIENDDAAKEL